MDQRAVLGLSLEELRRVVSSFSPEAMATITALVERTCTDAVRDMGLIAAATEPPADATDTERLMALAGRSIPH